MNFSYAMIYSMKRKKLLFFGAIAVLIVAGLGVWALSHQNSSSNGYFCAPAPGECKDPDRKHISNSQFKEASSYYISGTGGYECSRPIKLVSNTVDKQGEALDFNPVDESEAKLFCHMTSAEEYKGKIKVLQKPEVIKLIAQYRYKDVSIKALEFKYIQDKEYVHRLLPDYKDKEIGCIILLITPGVDKVYLEDENLNTFDELDYQTFAHYLDRVSPADKKLFYDNLK